MPKLLVVEVSPRYDHSISRQLTARFIAQWRELHPGGEVISRDLATTSLPYIDLAWIMGDCSPPEMHSAESAAAMKLSNQLIGELLAADHVLIGTPMHNLMIPASLKAYIDYIVRVGVTVSQRNEGLVTGKKAAVILATGGDFSPGSSVERFNYASPYLRQVLGYIGIDDLQIVLAGATRPITEGREAPDRLLGRLDNELRAIARSWATAVAPA
jgi:FMN-dependent NADH-azoreductase